MTPGLLKVIVQIVIVHTDENGYLTETLSTPVAIPARDWQGFCSEGFNNALELLIGQIS